MRLLEPSQTETHNNRIASLDFQRGLAIWLMTFLHTFEHVYDYNWVKDNPEDIFDLPLPVLIIGITVGFFASWNAYFLLISSIVNSLSMTRKTALGKDPKIILQKQLITGVGILGVGIVNDSFLFSGYFGNSLRTGNWRDSYPLWNGFFSMSTLQIIGWCIIINGFIHYFLMRNQGYTKYRRNYLVYTFLALGVIIMSPFIHRWVDNMNWENPPYLPENVGLGDHFKWPSIHFQAGNASFKSLIMTFIAGDMEPIFPYLATSFAGSVVGLALAKPEPIKKLPQKGGLSALGIMTIGGIFIASGSLTLSNNRPALGNYLLMLGAQLGAIFLLLRRVEYRGRAETFAQKKFVRHMRKWGIISLSVFALQIFELIPRWVLGSVANLWNSTEINYLGSSLYGYGQEYLALSTSIYVIVTFEFMLHRWSISNFKFSFEWFIIRLTSLRTKELSNRLNVEYILDKVNWYNPKIYFQKLEAAKNALETPKSLLH